MREYPSSALWALLAGSFSSGEGFGKRKTLEPCSRKTSSFSSSELLLFVLLVWSTNVDLERIGDLSGVDGAALLVVQEKARVR